MKVSATIQSWRAAGILGAIAIALMFFGGPRLENIRMAAAGPAEPVQWAASAGFINLARLFQRAPAADIAALRQRILALETNLAQQQALLQETMRKLESLGAAPRKGERNVCVADIIAFDSNSRRRSIALECGGDNGVRENHIAVWNGALVGRVVAVGPGSCRALLLDDPRFRVAARAESSGATGVLAGRGQNRCRLLFTAPNSSLIPGEKLFTAGTDGVFPPGYLVGTIAELPRPGEAARRVEVKPWLSAEQLGSVQLIEWTPPPADF